MHRATRGLLTRVLQLVAILLIVGMIVHDAAAVAHPVSCPERHEHAPTADPGGGLAVDAEMPTAMDGAHDHGSGRDNDAAVQCNGILISCFGCMCGEVAGVAAPPVVRSAVPYAPDYFTSVQPGVERRPPKAAA